MNVTPSIYLSFNGQCEAAFRFYERSLGGTIVSLFTFGGSPMATDTPPDWHGKVMHATIRIGDALVSGADARPEQYEPAKGFSLMLAPRDVTEAERLFTTLADGGTIHMPLQETFWAVRFGAVTDRFGIPWLINCEEAAAASTV